MKTSQTFAGLTDAQKAIISHWKSVQCENHLPLRSQINPGALKAHLSSISMIEIDEDGEARFRLIGSKLHSIFGGDMKGRNLSELGGETAAMWSLGLMTAIDRGAPAGGLLTRARDRHAWLRLPLDSGAPGKSLVLCHDTLLSLDDAEGEDPFDLFSATPGSLAA